MDVAIPGSSSDMHFPDRFQPMLARPTRNVPARGEWAAEIKWDGVRAIAYRQGGGLNLWTRAGNRLDERFSEISGSPGLSSGPDAVFDGELVAFDENGLPSFARLQKRLHRHDGVPERAGPPVIYVIFDLLHFDGRSLFASPYAARREALEGLELAGAHWQVPGYETGDLAGYLEASRGHGLEGLVLKRLDSRYEPGARSGAWLKLKNVNRREFVIGGWLPGGGSRSGRIGALLVGGWEGDGEARKLRYAGRVGTGFTSEWLDLLAAELEPLRAERSPFAGEVPRAARHVRPERVAEVEYRELTADGMLRHSSFKGLRPDKPAGEVEWEEA